MTAIPLRRRLPGAFGNLPGRPDPDTDPGPRLRGGRAAPIRSCSRWGLPCRLRCRRRGALLPHRFTLACTSCPAPAVSSLWHFPWGRPRRPLAATVDPWSPDFPPPRSMAAKPAHAAAAVRPAGRGNKGSLRRKVKGRAKRTRALDHSDLTLRPLFNQPFHREQTRRPAFRTLARIVEPHERTYATRPVGTLRRIGEIRCPALGVWS